MQELKNKLVLSTLLIFVFLCLPKASYAAFLEFDPTELRPKVGDTVNAKVNIDAEKDQVLSSDVRITYDPRLLQVVSISDGTYFSIAKKDFSKPGVIYIAGIIDTPGDFKVGKGTIATVSFKALAAGTGVLDFVCEDNVTATDSNIAKNVLDVPDIIACEKNGPADVIISGSTTTATAPTPTAATSGGGSGSGTSGSGGTSNQPAPSTLPRSGVLDDVAKAAIPGAILFLIGISLRMLL